MPFGEKEGKKQQKTTTTKNNNKIPVQINSWRASETLSGMYFWRPF